MTEKKAKTKLNTSGLGIACDSLTFLLLTVKVR